MVNNWSLLTDEWMRLVSLDIYQQLSSWTSLAPRHRAAASSRGVSFQCSLFAAGANPPLPACCSGVSHCCWRGGRWYFCRYGRAVGSLPNLLGNTEIAGACVLPQHLLCLPWDGEKGLVMTYSCRMKGTSVGSPIRFMAYDIYFTTPLFG